MSDILDHILKRRSIRRYTTEPVTEEQTRLLLMAAMAAPTACNQKPWEFVVVTDPEILARLRGKLMAGRYHAPCAIAVCGNERLGLKNGGRDHWVQDCSAATQNILLAAAGIGLGAVWIGVYPLPSVIRPVREILALPEGVTPLCLVYVGHPAEEKAPRTQYDERRVYRQQYEPRKPRLRKKNMKHEE